MPTASGQRTSQIPDRIRRRRAMYRETATAKAWSRKDEAYSKKLASKAIAAEGSGRSLSCSEGVHSTNGSRGVLQKQADFGGSAAAEGAFGYSGVTRT